MMNVDNKFFKDGLSSFGLQSIPLVSIEKILMISQYRMIIVWQVVGMKVVTWVFVFRYW